MERKSSKEIKNDISYCTINSNEILRRSNIGEKLTCEIVENETKINERLLEKAALEKYNENPEIDDVELAVLLLKKVASDKKYKRMAKIAKNMLDEKWWLRK